MTPQEDTKERALKAILCWYHPDADKSVWRTKADWAREFGIDRPRFTYWEARIGEETIDMIKRGVVPLPDDRPPLQVSSAHMHAHHRFRQQHTCWARCIQRDAQDS